MRPSRTSRPAPDDDRNLPHPPRRRPFSRTKGAALLAAALLVALLAALTLPGMWRETQRREAYLPVLEAQAARAPDDGPLLALVGAGRLAAGENAGAADALRQAVADGESNDAVWEALAAAAAASGDRTRALADLRLGLKALPASTALQGALARARVVDLDAPPPILAQAVAPDGPAVLRERYAAGSALNGMTEWWGRRHPDASGFATRQGWARERPGDAQAQRLWGEALLRNRRLPEARLALGLALSLAPDSPAVNLAVADGDAQAGDAPRAERQYLVCLHLRPHWPPALLGFGGAALQNGQVPYAVTAFTRAAQAAPRSADAWIGLGQAQLKTGVAFDLSVEAFRNAARLAPARTDYLDDYADALRRSGHASEAETALRRRLGAVPDDALAHYLLGRVLRDTDPTPPRVAEAEAQTRESLRLSPHNPLADTQLGQVLLDAGRTPEAVALFEDARARTPDDPKLLRVLARAYGRQGKPAQAAAASARAQALLADEQRADVLVEASRKTPLDIGLHRQLLALYARDGKAAQAQREADTVHLLQTDPKGTAQQRSALDAAIQTALSAQ